MTRHIQLESDMYDFEVEVDDDVDLDGTFDALCVETGERLRINGWMFIATDITDSDLNGWTPAWEMRNEQRALGATS